MEQMWYTLCKPSQYLYFFFVSQIWFNLFFSLFIIEKYFLWNMGKKETLRLSTKIEKIQSGRSECKFTAFVQ